MEEGKGKTETLILSKKDEQERVQKKTFTNWINTYLIQAHPPYKIENLYESITDGLCLIHLLEVMTGEKLVKEQPKKMQKIHRLSNINTALEFLKKRKIKLVNINATDIADGRPSIILGLMWTIILFFQIEEQEELLISSMGPNYDGKVNAKTALLNWVNKTIGDKYNLNVTDFGSCWRDGKAFNALVHNIDSNLINWDKVKNKSNKDNLVEAFKQAEQLGIPSILDVQDVDVEKPDEKSIMTYIAQFLKSYPEGGKGIEDEMIAINKAKEEAAQRALEEELERRRMEEEARRRKQEEEEARRKKEEEERELKRRKLEEEKRRKEEAEQKKREEEERQKKLVEEEEIRRKFNKQMTNMSKWTEDFNLFLDDELECDIDALNSYLDNLNGLLSDKDLIDEDLSILKDDIKHGKCGAEYSKPYMESIQALEKQLKDSVTKASSIKNALSQNIDQLKAFENTMDQVDGWIADLDKALENIDNAENEQELDIAVQNFKTQLNSEPMCEKLLKEAKEIYSKIKNCAPKNLQEADVLNKIHNVESQLKKKTDEGKAMDKSLTDFNKALNKANEFQKDYEKKLNSIGSTSNDISKLKQQLEKIENLKKLQADGNKVIQEAIEKGQAALSNSNNLQSIQKKINSDLEDTENKWMQNTDNLDTLKDKIMDSLAKAEGLMRSGNKVESWLKEKETDFRKCKNPCDTLSQKQVKVDELKKLLSEIENDAPTVQDYIRQLKEVSETDPNAKKKMETTKQQFEDLKKYIKETIKDAEKHVEDHEDFVDKLDGASEWIEKAKALKADAASKDAPGSIDELKRRKEILEQFIASKLNGEALVKAAVNSGENVARETSLKGKEEILSKVRGLNKDFHDLLDGLGAVQHTIEMKLTKASNIDRDLEALSNWADEFENKLNNLEDSDIDKAKALCEEAQGKLYMSDNLYNQTKSMDDPEFQARAEQIKMLIKENLGNAQQKYSQIKDNLHSYNDLMKGCRNLENWLNEADKSVTKQGDSSWISPEEMNNNLRSLEKLAAEIKAKRNEIDNIQSHGMDLSSSCPSKSPEIESILNKIAEKYENLKENAEEKYRKLKENLKDQKDFDEAMHKAQQWLNDATHKLLKYSDVKQCTPPLIDSFSRNFESIVESLPSGEECINEAMYTGNKHLDHLNEAKSKGENNLERDTKKVNELKKNWNDFKKQLDLVNNNVNRVKENLNDFNMLHQKLDSYIKEKENAMKNPLSVNSLKNMLFELEDASKNLDQFQTKAVDIASIINYPNAPSTAKGIVERYQNLKRCIDAELNKAKQIENDWIAYKNAANVCEKWIVDTGFRIIDNDYSAYSPEEAQTTLDDFARMCDQINNFSQDVDKVVKIGNQLAGKIIDNQKMRPNSNSQTNHSEGEIKNDIENLKSSHKNLMENANQIKNRLTDQLTNWRKYRDLVQVNDQYLSNDLNDWWRNKKYFPPQTDKDINANIKEAEEILNSLLSKQAEMKMSKSNCQMLSNENGPKSFSETKEVDRKRKLSLSTPLSRLAESVEANLEKNIEEIHKYIPQMETLLHEWKSFDKDIQELEKWTKHNEDLFEKKIGQPSLKSSSLTEDQRQYGEQLKKEIENQEKSINKLLDKSQAIGNKKINPLLKRIDNLKKNLKRLLDRRDEEIDAANFDTVDRCPVACQNSGYLDSENMSTQTLPEKCNMSTSTDPRTRKIKTQTLPIRSTSPVKKNNAFGMRNSGGNRGISKMLYPYCCTSDLLQQKLHLDYLHGPSLQNYQNSNSSNYSPRRLNGDIRSSKIGISKIRNGTEESVRRNWMTQDLI